MSLNCKPGQRAWICVPNTEQARKVGLDQVHGHVVQTVKLHPGAPASESTWIVDPPQSCKVPGFIRSQIGVVVPGTVLRFEGVPDAYLRPFDDFPPEELEQLQRELVS